MMTEVSFWGTVPLNEKARGVRNKKSLENSSSFLLCVPQNNLGLRLNNDRIFTNFLKLG